MPWNFLSASERLKFSPKIAKQLFCLPLLLTTSCHACKKNDHQECRWRRERALFCQKYLTAFHFALVKDLSKDVRERKTSKNHLQDSQVVISIRKSIFLTPHIHFFVTESKRVLHSKCQKKVIRLACVYMLMYTSPFKYRS